MAMNWNSGRYAYDNISREARRLVETFGENNLSEAEVDAFSKLLFEIAWAVAVAQPHPVGGGRSVSLEAMAEVQKLADMIERERFDNCSVWSSVPRIPPAKEFHGAQN